MKSKWNCWCQRALVKTWWCFQSQLSEAGKSLLHWLEGLPPNEWRIIFFFLGPGYQTAFLLTVGTKHITSRIRSNFTSSRCSPWEFWGILAQPPLGGTLKRKNVCVTDFRTIISPGSLDLASTTLEAGGKNLNQTSIKNILDYLKQTLVEDWLLPTHSGHLVWPSCSMHLAAHTLNEVFDMATL